VPHEGDIVLRPIGHVRTEHTDRDSTPSQAPYYAEQTGEVVVLPEYVAGLRGLEGFDYVWLLCWFDRLAGDPPRLEEVPHPLRGTGRSFGVYATRSPARPNNVGLSRVRLLGIEGDRVRFAGVDMMDATPVIDIKPFMATVDIPPEGMDVRSGWLDELDADRDRR
jgi:tRNA-Thr(GGU) m(6)t(6)A37 methyltransferase TsaA